MSSKNPHAGHRERLRQRFLNSECDQLYEHELLELLLFYARPVVNTNNIAHALNENFGSVGKVLSAERDELQSIKGVGGSGALFLKFMNDLGLDYLRSVNSYEKLSTVSELSGFFTKLFSDSDARLCALLCLGSRSELIDTITIPTEDIYNGTITQKELAAMLLRNGTVRVCAGINHGSGLPLPDNNDYLTVNTIAKLLSAVGIDFADCIIVSSCNCFSMCEKGAFTF